MRRHVYMRVCTRCAAQRGRGGGCGWGTRATDGQRVALQLQPDAHALADAVAEEERRRDAAREE
eukprot:876483-Pleurochrysis_carterae.AAC.1